MEIEMKTFSLQIFLLQVRENLLRLFKIPWSRPRAKTMRARAYVKWGVKVRFRLRTGMSCASNGFLKKVMSKERARAAYY